MSLTESGGEAHPELREHRGDGHRQVCGGERPGPTRVPRRPRDPAVSARTHPVAGRPLPLPPRLPAPRPRLRQLLLLPWPLPPTRRPRPRLSARTPRHHAHVGRRQPRLSAPVHVHLRQLRLPRSPL